MGKKVMSVYWAQLKLVIAYLIGFVMKLLWKYCECGITFIFVENPNSCYTQVKVFNIFIRYSKNQNRLV